MDPVQRPERGKGPPVAGKTFRPFAPDQGLVLPPSLDEWLPDDHLARRFYVVSSPRGLRSSRYRGGW